MSDLYLRPPSAPIAYPGTLPSGTVALYDNNKDWNGTTTKITTGNATPGIVYSLAGTNSNDNSDWVAFNLPIGVVLTLLENPIVTADNPYNFANAGRCVDLIGNGQLQTVNLNDIGAANCISAYIWRDVDLEAGGFQLFDGIDFTGNRNTFFLTEWGGNNAHNSLAGWWICDKAASAYFGALSVQTVTLYDGGSGDGVSCAFSGWYSSLQINNLGPYSNFNDKAASWSWVPVNPVAASVQPVQISTIVPKEALSTTVFPIAVTNPTAATITPTPTIVYSTSTSTTVTVTQSVENAYFQGFTASYTIGDTLLEGESGTISATMSITQTFTNTNEIATTQTQQTDYSMTIPIAVPPYSNFYGTATVSIAPMPLTSFTTPGTYYYKQPVRGGVATTLAPYGTVYTLTKPVTGTISGGVCVPVQVIGSPTPMAVPMPTAAE